MIMKKRNCLLILLIFVLGSCVSIKQSSRTMNVPNPHYKDLISFNKDTLTYVKTNFYQNQQFYVGKPVEVLLDDLEVDIFHFTPSSLFNPMDKSNGVSLTIRYTTYVEQSDKSLIENPTIVDLIVKFTELYLYDDALELSDLKADINWGKAQEDFYKDFIIKEIFIYIPEKD